MKKKTGSVLVVGAGISGVRSALDLAELGYGVILVDKASHLGGTLRQLDFQFPDDHCGMCRMLPMVERDSSSQFCLRKGLFHENIEIRLNTEVTALEGEPGKFRVALRRKPASIDEDRCTGCGECVRVCPVEVPDDLFAGVEKRKAVYLPLPHGIPNSYTVDSESCNRCGECVKACPAGAIDFAREGGTGAESTVEVGAVILAAGFGMYDPASGINTYGYGEYPNVVTSLEFEQLIRGTGQFEGRRLWLSDGRKCRSIAWLQCVGSRNIRENADFCSSICCMFSIKEALRAKELSGGNADVSIFYMDMRTFGKDFQRYRDHAEKESGVRFVRSRVHSVEPEGSDGALRLSYTDIDGEMHSEVFDLVVLATGARLPGKAGELACAMNLELNPWGFLKVPPFSPGRSSRKGVYLSGSCVGPMDISESVIAASSASLASSISIHSMGGSLAEAPAGESPYRDVSRDLPRTAVALCTCSGTLAEGVDLDAVTAELAVRAPAGGVFRIARLCTRDGWAELKAKMNANRANRLLIGACTPHVFAGKLKELGESAGIAPSLMDVADVLGSVAPAAGGGRGRPAKEILAVLNVGIARLEGMEPVESSRTGMVQRALVVGGGIAGMTAALSIADHGFEVSLIEESGELGTHLRKLRSSFQGASPLELLERTIAMTEKHPLIRVHMKTRAIHSQGCMGSFVTTVEKEDGSGETIEHGVTILAPSGKVAETASYCCGRSESVMTGRELDEKLLTGAIDPGKLGTVAMIQCVDSRDENRSYCSRVCCAAALRIALHIKEKNPDADVVIFYRDMMAYGFQEAHYTEARKAGVVFIQYEPDKKPVVELEDGRVTVRARDPILGRDVVVEPDLLALNTGIVPSDHRRVAAVFGVELNEDGFFREACSKWRPVDAMKEGIFLCGIAHSPRSATESIATAHAAAQRSLTLLSRRTITGSSIVAKVRQSLCARCGRCIDACPYGARYRDEEDRVQVSETGCQGCGSCAAVCLNGASVLGGYSDRQVLSMIDAALS